MRIDWRLVGVSPEGAIHPAWTETSVCEACGLNSRMRALLAFVLGHSAYTENCRCYLAERLTVSYPVFARHFAKLETSEYFGPGRKAGESIWVPSHATRVRHEDLTQLSFENGSFDWVVTQDVFEHIPDYQAAFHECARVLSPRGQLVFSVPFNSGLSRTQTRAVLKGDGSVEHLMQPEIHGNPVDDDGALCFHNFGWDILDALRDAGFTEVGAHAYWGPWCGHVGVGGFVFSATKGEF
jgi:SAM-dependent methyltransferase